MTADIGTHALTMAWFRRKPGPGVIFHSNRGPERQPCHAGQAGRARHDGLDEPQGQLQGQRAQRKPLQQPED
jgi:hypothetical protein